MKFLVDAHLPPSLCEVLRQRGHEVSHTLDLPAKNVTKDSVISQISVDEERVVISKDSDFFYSHVLRGRPWKLVMVKTGNISTTDLCSLFERNMADIEAALRGTLSLRLIARQFGRYSSPSSSVSGFAIHPSSSSSG